MTDFDEIMAFHNVSFPEAVEIAATLDTVPEGYARFGRFYSAYLAMAKRADYRPQAPGDGMGHTYLSKEEAQDAERLHKEAEAYAKNLGII